MPRKLLDTKKKPSYVVLVGLILPFQREEDINAEMDELKRLAITADMQVVGQFTQRLKKPDGRTMVGKGKMEEIEDYIKENDVDRVIFNNGIFPVQVKNLEGRWKVEVWDRTMLILAIFSMRARTLRTKIQVKLAQYQYLLPRLKGMWSHHVRQQGGIGSRGPGEKELETDRRMAQYRISTLKKKLEEIEKSSKVQRKERSKKINVALVGYTNAGKSTLMKCISKDDTLIDDKLFVTVSPLVRKARIKEKDILLSDTVGFIRKLPPTLIEGFKSTLAEVCDADVLLHVIDFSDPQYERYITVVKQILREIGAVGIPTIFVLNKRDKLLAEKGDFLKNYEEKNKKTFFVAQKEKLSSLYQCPVVYCSALSKEGTQDLHEVLYKAISKNKHRSYARIRYTMAS